MSGMRAFTAEEEAKILAAFKGEWAERNRAVFRIQCATGFRIAEVLSLRVGQVVEIAADGRKQIVDRIEVKPRHMKGKKKGRSVAIFEPVKSALASYIEWLFHRTGHCLPTDPLFPTRTVYPLGYDAYIRILQRVAKRCGLAGRIGTHSCRKSFVQGAYNYAKTHEELRVDPLRFAQRLAGHARLDSTARYLPDIDQPVVDEALRTLQGNGLP